MSLCKSRDGVQKNPQSASPMIIVTENIDRLVGNPKFQLSFSGFGATIGSLVAVESINTVLSTILLIISILVGATTLYKQWVSKRKDEE